MRHLQLSAYLLLPSLFAAGAASQGPIADSTPVASVAGQPVTLASLRSHLHRYHGVNALEELIDRSVLAQEAERYQVAPKDAELEALLRQARANPDFENALKLEGISEATWKDRARQGLLLRQTTEKKWPVKSSDLERLTVRYVRVTTERVAKDIIRQTQLAKGANFELFARRDSLDPENAGLLQPEKFLRIDQPQFFRMATNANLRVGQVTPQPIKSGEYWLVLRLEGYHPAENMTTAERDLATRRITTYRMVNFLSTSRKRYRIEKKGSVAEPLPDPAAEVASVTPAKGEKKVITSRDLWRHLLAYYGNASIEKLIQRAVVDREAVKLGISLGSSELSSRTAEMQRQIGKTTFQANLGREGITEEVWRDRVRYYLLAEKIQSARQPITADELVRVAVRFLQTSTSAAAQELIRALQGGASVEDLKRRPGVTQEGLVRPSPFLRLDNPVVFDAIPRNLGAGQVVPQPLQIGSNWYALKLEGRFTGEMMTIQEKETVTRRINLLRMDATLEALRRAARPEVILPSEKLLAAG